MVTFQEGEVFPNPTVKRVIFQVRFPNLFFLESRLGDLQLKIMERYPESELRVQRTVVFAQGAADDLVDQARKKAPGEQVKIWIFRSRSGITAEVKQDAVTLLTESYRSYRSGELPFRDEIQFMLSAFHDVTSIPIANRVGLRYTDHCPLLGESTDLFTSYYNTSLSVCRFPLETCSEFAVKALVHRGENRQLRYQESIEKAESGRSLVLDFDAFAESVKWGDLLATTDSLYSIIRSEFQKTINEPVLEYMRKRPGG